MGEHVLEIGTMSWCRVWLFVLVLFAVQHAPPYLWTRCWVAFTMAFIGGLLGLSRHVRWARDWVIPPLRYNNKVRYMGDGIRVDCYCKLRAKSVVFRFVFFRQQLVSYTLVLCIHHDSSLACEMAILTHVSCPTSTTHHSTNVQQHRTTFISRVRRSRRLGGVG